jgi:hypothetical protein
MSKNYAKFDQERYDKFDGKAKNALVSYLEQEGHSIKSAVEDYHADVTSTRQGATYYSEAEVKTAWKEAWPKDWAELRIPARKARLLKRHSIITFYVFRNDLQECWVVKGEQLTLDSLKEAYGPKISKGEMFFHIPVKEAKLIRHDENGWAEVVQESAAPQKTTTGAKNRKTKAVPERTENQSTDDSAGTSGDG